MEHSNRSIKLMLFAAAAAIAAFAVVQLRAKRRTVDVTAQGIHDQLDALDPVMRSAVIARLTADAVKDVKERERR
jgi:ABC-type uncharacterized transport system substrate-binding protein